MAYEVFCQDFFTAPDSIEIFFHRDSEDWI